MNDSSVGRRWGMSPVTAIGGALAVAGLMLSSVSGWWLGLTVAGLFGPGILRELGLIRDQDEFQRAASYRSGQHAYLLTGSAAAILVMLQRAVGWKVDHPDELPLLFASIACFTWLTSRLMGYWGVVRAASRILLVFGSGWLVFTILSNLGSEWRGWWPLLLHPLLAVPFFALAWLVPRHPRTSGLLLIGASLFFIRFFGFFERTNLANVDQAITCLLFVGPLAASGLALSVSGRRDGSLDDDDDEAPEAATASPFGSREPRAT